MAYADGADLCLPEQLRSLLASPPVASRLSAAPWLEPGVAHGCVIAVGDVVARLLLEHGVKPFGVIADCATMRRNSGCPRLEDHYTRIEKVANPQGRITPEAYKAAYSIARHGGALIVEGEEDLLALPAILGARQGCIVAYGYPGLASILVPVGSWVKRLVLSILSSFAPCGPKS